MSSATLTTERELGTATLSTASELRSVIERLSGHNDRERAGIREALAVLAHSETYSDPVETAMRWLMNGGIRVGAPGSLPGGASRQAVELDPA